MPTIPLIESQTTGTGPTKQEGPDFSGGTTKSFEVRLTGTGAITATVVIEVKNDPEGVWLSESEGTVTLSGTDEVSGGCMLLAQWKQIRANVATISGTGAKVKATMGY